MRVGVGVTRGKEGRGGVSVGIFSDGAANVTEALNGRR